MKFKLKEDGLKGDQLSFVQSLNAKFAEMPEAATAEDIQKAINDEFTKATGEKGMFQVAAKAAVDAAIADITDESKPASLAAIVKRQGAQIAAMKEGGVPGAQKTLVEALEGLKDHFKAISDNRQGVTVFNVEFDRANKGMRLKLEGGRETLKIKTGPETVAGVIANDITTATGLRLGDGPFYEIKRNRFFLTDFLNVGETNQAFLIWWDETPKNGDFAITAEGVMKPQVQYEFARKSSDYKKIAGYMVITDEFFMDMGQLVTQIRRLAQIDIMNDLQSQVIADMIAALPGYTYTGLNGKIYHADDYAAIGAAITQIQSLFFQPTVIALNPADHWKMRLTKDDVGRYQMPPFAFDGETFEFGTVVVNPAIPLGNFFVGDGTTFNLDFRGGMMIRIGYNGTDFVQNQQTLLVEQYYYDYIPTNRLGAWVYGNFSVIKGAINDTTNS